MADLQQKIEDAQTEGWTLDKETHQRAVMKKRGFGSIGSHVAIALLTVWWTFGIGNAVWAAHSYFNKGDTKVLRPDEDE
jgi:hypothetical protein